MRHRNRGIWALVALLLCTLCAGCQLAKPDAGADAAAHEDRLIGFFATQEPLDLFDFEAYFNDHANRFLGGGNVEISEEDSAAYGGRLYAERSTGDGRSSFRFPGIEGSGMYVYTYEDEHGSVSASGGDGLISDGHTFVGNDSSVEGTLYVVPQEFISVYVNPVYQSADGSVYLTAGQGLSFGGETGQTQGQIVTQTLTERYTTTVDGETTERSFTATLHIAVLFAPERIIVQQMAASGAVLSRDEYAPDAMPESIAPAAEAAYLIVETHSTAPDGTPYAGRQLLGTDDSSLVTYCALESGVCQAVWTEIGWPA